jgi:homoserine O-succinyltransferase
LIRDVERRQTYMFNHLEYDTSTLTKKYHHDIAVGAQIQLPAYYFPENDPEKEPTNSWRAHGSLLICNWIYNLYQSTSFELVDIPQGRQAR